MEQQQQLQLNPVAIMRWNRGNSTVINWCTTHPVCCSAGMRVTTNINRNTQRCTAHVQQCSLAVALGNELCLGCCCCSALPLPLFLLLPLLIILQGGCKGVQFEQGRRHCQCTAAVVVFRHSSSERCTQCKQTRQAGVALFKRPTCHSKKRSLLPCITLLTSGLPRTACPLCCSNRCSASTNHDARRPAHTRCCNSRVMLRARRCQQHSHAGIARKC